MIANHDLGWVIGRRLAELTGLTVKAIDRKRERGIWKEGEIWVRRDGGIWYSIRAVNAWAEGQTTQASSPIAGLYVSASRSRKSAAANR